MSIPDLKVFLMAQGLTIGEATATANNIKALTEETMAFINDKIVEVPQEQLRGVILIGVLQAVRGMADATLAEMQALAAATADGPTGTA